MKFQINTKRDKNFQIAVIQLAVANGYRCSTSLSDDGIDDIQSQIGEYNFFVFDSRTKNLSANSDFRPSFGEEVAGIGELCRHLREKKVIEVRLNDEYTAKVFSDGSVAVGCQKFSSAAIQNLIKAVNNI